MHFLTQGKMKMDVEMSSQPNLHEKCFGHEERGSAWLGMGHAVERAIDCLVTLRKHIHAMQLIYRDF